LLSALRLLFKTVEQHAVDVTLSADFTTYLTEISASSESVNVSLPPPGLSEDVIAETRQREVPTRRLRLVESNGLAESAPCAWQPVLCSEPVFEAMSFSPIDVDFDNMTQSATGAWPIPALKAPTKGQPIEKMPAPAVKGAVEAKAFSTKVRNLADQLPSVKVQNNPRFYALPIRKASIPPHRFPPEVREKFRQALAEKAATHEGNVQLKMIYERMNMGLYSGIQVDDTGSLMCTPKSELIGRNAERATGAPAGRPLAVGSESSYLVLGVRLDNKADIRALVPVESLDLPMDDGPVNGTRGA